MMMIYCHCTVSFSQIVIDQIRVKLYDKEPLSGNSRQKSNNPQADAPSGKSAQATID
jgi:hypothetical protein